MFRVLDDYLGSEEVFHTYDEAEEYCGEQEIIYYSEAMNYLIENDVSLTESFRLVSEYGFTFDNLNSEVLATIHYQDSLVNSIDEVHDFEQRGV